MNEKALEVKETIEIGGTIYNVDDVTPSVYFEHVKNSKKDIEDENLQVVADNCLTLLNKAKLTGQTSMAKKIFFEYEIIMKELKAASFGFNVIVYKSDIEKFITDISKHPVKIIELENYPREVDDSVVDKLMLAKENNLFDQYYVLFTDYTGKETKKVAEHRKDKDPILFGAFINENKNSIPDERFFYIGDWIDEYCDLTLDKMLQQYESKENVGAKYDITIPTNVDELKEYMGLIEKKDPDKSTLISKVKEAVKTAVPRKRGRKPKKVEE